MADHFPDEKGGSLGIAESRTHLRAPVRSLAYVELSDGNGGLILNISEDGFAVQAVQIVSAEQLSRMRFRLPKTDLPIEAAGRLVWQLRSKKEAGIQFVDLSDEAREGIRQWIGTGASQHAVPADVSQQKTSQSPKPVVQKPAATGAQTPSPRPSGQASSPEPPVAAPPRAKPKEPSPPAEEPVIASPRLPISPPPPSAPAPPFASSAPPSGPRASAPPISEPRPGPRNGPAGRPPSPGSAFPPGRIPLRNVPRSDGGHAQPPMPASAPNMPSWNGYVAPGIGLRYGKPRRWWTYTAALGIIAAVGFAGLMMIDPSTISRARLATTHEPEPTTSLPQSGSVTNNTGPNSPPSTNTQPSPSATSGLAAGANSQGAQQTPPIPAPGNVSPAPMSSAANGNATEQTGPTVPANPPAASNSTATSKSGRDGSASRDESASEESERSKHAENATNESGAAREGRRENPRSGNVEPSQSAPAATNQTAAPISSSATANNVQPSPSSPTAAPPVTTTPPSASQSSATQRDQDAYARTARREEEAAAANSTKPPVQQVSGASPGRTPSSSASQGSSVVMSGEPSSPVPPSAPLVGVPSGSVGATSRFHSFRIPPELQSKAAQLAGTLQIGQILSSYSPSYPVDAARAGVEGIVKLDVMVAPNGNVESATIVSGPPMLTAVSVSAVKQWHYGETLLGGQPVEAEQYVTLIFRLAK